MRYDIEDVLDNIESILKNNLNDEINAINTEKSDSVTISEVDQNAYIYQSMDNEISNYDPFVWFGVVNIETENAGPYPANKLSMHVMILETDKAEGENMTRRMLRYQKALMQTLEKNWHQGGISNKLEITTLMPVTVSGLNETNSHRVVGLEIRTTIT